MPKGRLVLSRNVGESITITGNEGEPLAVVKLERRAGKRTIFTIESPLDVRIMRTEVLGRIVRRAVDQASEQTALVAEVGTEVYPRALEAA